MGNEYRWLPCFFYVYIAPWPTRVYYKTEFVLLKVLVVPHFAFKTGLKMGASVLSHRLNPLSWLCVPTSWTLKKFAFWPHIVFFLHVYQNVQRLLPYTAIMVRLFIADVQWVSCAVWNKFICTCVFLRRRSMYCSLLNTKTSLYTPVETLVSAFDIYHQNVTFGSGSMY